jgi:hypothetical protein
MPFEPVSWWSMTVLQSAMIFELMRVGRVAVRCFHFLCDEDSYRASADEPARKKMFFKLENK